MGREVIADYKDAWQTVIFYNDGTYDVKDELDKQRHSGEYRLENSKMYVRNIGSEQWKDADRSSDDERVIKAVLDRLLLYDLEKAIWDDKV